MGKKKIEKLLENSVGMVQRDIFHPFNTPTTVFISNREVLRAVLPLLQEIVKTNWSSWIRPYYIDEFIKHLKKLAHNQKEEGK